MIRYSPQNPLYSYVKRVFAVCATLFATVNTIRMINRSLFLIFLLIICSSPLFAQAITVFENGEAGYRCFRIPAIVSAPSGNLLAFAEGRRNNCGDFGDVDVVMKISTDQGKSWGELRIVAENQDLQAGNPAPVFDFTDPNFPEGRLFLIYNTGNASEQKVREGKGVREVWVKTSVDEGTTWSEAQNITTYVHRPNNPSFASAYTFSEDWRSYANTPGHAIQLTKGRYRGRLLVPANHSVGPPKADFTDYRAHAFFSDDHGKTWQLSDEIDFLGSNESTAAQLANGQVLMNMRNQMGEPKFRLVAKSKDGGKTWGNTIVETQLPDPVCEGSILAVGTKSGKRCLLFSNLNHQSLRQNLTIYRSDDRKGESWKRCKTVEEGSAAYSDLVEVQRGLPGILYEKEEYSKIVFQAFVLD